MLCVTRETIMETYLEAKGDENYVTRNDNVWSREWNDLLSRNI